MLEYAWWGVNESSSKSGEEPVPGPGWLIAPTDSILGKDNEISPTDSGGGTKHDDGKPPMELLDPFALEQVAKVLAFGKQKYDAHNWRKGIEYGRLIGAALRHTLAFVRGEDNDKESDLPHLAHAMCCLMFLLEMTQIHPELDDRWKPSK